MIFTDWEGTRYPAQGRVGQTLLEVATAYKIDLEGRHSLPFVNLHLVSPSPDLPEVNSRVTLLGRCGNRGSNRSAKRTDQWTEAVFGEGESTLCRSLALHSCPHQETSHSLLSSPTLSFVSVTGPKCDTCHVIIDGTHFQKLEPADDDEEVLLGGMFGGLRKPTSRLGCQIQLTKDLDGMVVLIPDSPDVEPV